VARLQLPRGAGCVRLSPDGGRVGVADGSLVHFHDAECPARRETLEVTGELITDLAFAPDGLTAAAATDSGVVVFDL
jgi:hypothetical protein